MKRYIAVLLWCIQILALETIDGFAQDRSITRSEFLTFMSRSEEATKKSPYRKIVTVEIGDAPDGIWKPYSSMVDEVIMPDRSHLTYKSGPPREYVRIGKNIYSKEMNGGWVLTGKEAEGWRVSTASEPIFKGPITEYWILDPNGKEHTTVIKVVSRPEMGKADIETRRLFYTYSFDEMGLLRQQTSIGFNGKNWVKSTENIEYDASIRIETPLN